MSYDGQAWALQCWEKEVDPGVPTGARASRAALGAASATGAGLATAKAAQERTATTLEKCILDYWGGFGGWGISWEIKNAENGTGCLAL